MYANRKVIHNLSNDPSRIDQPYVNGVQLLLHSSNVADVVVLSQREFMLCGGIIFPPTCQMYERRQGEKILLVQKADPIMVLI